MANPAFSRPALVRAISFVLVVVFPVTAVAAPPRAAAITASPHDHDFATRVTLARNALAALDRTPSVTPLRAEALREALIPTSVDAIDPSAEAFALASSAPAIAAQNALAGAALYERALSLVFEKLPSASARRFLTVHADAAEKRLRAAQRLTPLLERRLRLWRDPKPQGALAKVALAIEPEGAAIYLDGTRVGAAKSGDALTIEHEVGAHDLRVEKDGFAPMSRVLELGPPVTPGAAPARVVLGLVALGGTEDVVKQRAALDGAKRSLADLGPLLGELAERLDVALLFFTTPDDGGALVRLYDAKAKAFAGASPVATADVTTLARAYRALLELRATGTRLVSVAIDEAGGDHPAATKKGSKKKKRVKGDPLWKKWWFWTIALVGAGAVTGAVLLTQSGGEGTLTLQLRRTP